MLLRLSTAMATATATNAEAESQLQSNLFHRQVICLQKQMFCNLLTRKFLCVLALFAVARFLPRPRPPSYQTPHQTLVYIVCAVVSFVVYTVLGISQSQSLALTLCSCLSRLHTPSPSHSRSLPFAFSLPLWQLLCK